MLQTTAQYYGFKNRIINGAMVIDQRNNGGSVTGNDVVFPVDRFRFNVSQSSKLTAQQNQGSVTPPSGFANYLGITSSSAYSVSSTDYFNICQFIEGYNVADFGWGTANAKTVTLSFQVYSSLTGTFGGSILNAAANRCYVFSYSVPSANTWTTVSITIPGDTTGTWLTNSGQGLLLLFGLGVGSSVSGSAGSWGSTLYRSATGATSVVGTNGATFYITGVQLEVGTQATSFDYRPYGIEIQLCQRYYETSYYPGYAVPTNACPNYVNISIGNGSQNYIGSSGGSNSQTVGHIFYRVNKRSQAPSVVTYSYSSSTTGVASKGWSGTDLGASTAVVNVTSSFGFSIYNNSLSNATTDGYSLIIHYASNAEL